MISSRHIFLSRYKNEMLDNEMLEYFWHAARNKIKCDIEHLYDEDLAMNMLLCIY